MVPKKAWPGTPTITAIDGITICIAHVMSSAPWPAKMFPIIGLSISLSWGYIPYIEGNQRACMSKPWFVYFAHRSRSSRWCEYVCCRSACMLTYIDKYIHIYIDTYTYIHMYIYTCIHIYIVETCFVRVTSTSTYSAMFSDKGFSIYVSKHMCFTTHCRKR